MLVLSLVHTGLGSRAGCPGADGLGLLVALDEHVSQLCTRTP